MNCAAELQRKNYSATILNQAMDDDAGSWWWWTNVIVKYALGTLLFGIIGIIGNIICFLVVCRFALPQHSFVEYLRSLAIFDFLSLLFECIQSLHDLFSYLFSINLLNFRSSIICKLYEYLNHVIILLSCWAIVSLTFDRLILVCDPWAKRWPNLSRRICNSKCAKRIIFLLIILSLLINIPHLLYQEWICRKPGYQYSAAFIGNLNLNETKSNPISKRLLCQCRTSPYLSHVTLLFYVTWKIYIFHLFCYTLIPAIILIASNTAILKLIHSRRQIVGQKNEHLRSKLTRTLTLVSIMFLILYFPHAIVQTLSILIFPNYHKRCDIRSLIIIRILKRLSELMNITALGINFFIYILGVNHYRSAAIKMLGLHNFNLFLPYLTVEHRNSIGSTLIHSNKYNRTNIQMNNSTIQLLTIKNNENLNQISKSSLENRNLSK
ncbi:unnamed protein product [Rotaria magnacalcarata]|uniref:G-protein coupled receptors family 1 profile domain-containing protein n=1 Tax=Rotaria magnacalcarata TaxID=392030 RepID=A0A814S7D3_9BILA|nr:unnamed protein product [Rotaria magnacalcarata]CAF2069816.1 unnamed protein product [Rotaria magnacalcarata]CAF3754390.1 unnamed protein product [Rotaria magnacalcarata]CAF3818802.1 unnamed protein product [Rotaria magnacalcarata]